MDYFQLQEAVFNYLWDKHQQDKSFTFSVRQKASKGAEKNYFIGTSKSSYFGFTCWDIPVYFPGSSADLTNFIFTVKERCFLRFQYGGMVKTQTDPQSIGDLAFGYELLKNLQEAGVPVSTPDDKNKILYYYLEPDPKGYSDIKSILEGFEKLYAQVATIVDHSVENAKKNHPDWQAGRYTPAKFDNLIQKMHSRLQRFASGTPLLPSEIEEEPTIENLSLSVAGNKVKHFLNTILYGPPGTGKTYNTVNKAVAVANPDFVQIGKSREEIKAEYDRLLEARQIQFVTFHQSLSYEDFIEGIKPVEPKDADTFLKYKVEDGIFKRMVELAAYVPNIQEAGVYLSDDEFSKAFFYSLTLNSALQAGDKTIYRYCIDHNCIALNVAEGIDANGKSEAEIKASTRTGNFEPGEGAALSKFVHHLKQGNYVLLCDGDSTCRAIGKVTGDYEYKPNDEVTPDHFRSVEWLVKDAQIPREQLYAAPFTYGIERLDRDEVKKEFFTKKTVAVRPELVRKNFVLIIDEINRGNVSQIFGELITLIEEDKRRGKSEALTATLPYSKKPFSVPDNLYIIGTMNTADRSVEALDTALRRRFVFEEMEPRPELLNSKRLMWQFLWKHKDDLWIDESFQEREKEAYTFFGADQQFENERKEIWDQMEEEREMKEEQITKLDKFTFNGVDLSKLLATINRRLEVLLTKDHTIGHAWLMDVYSLDDLRNAFKNKILPLLQEYFYNNYAKMGLVLGDNFFQEQKQSGKALFASFKNGAEIAEDFGEKVVYILKDTKDLEVADFQSIYRSGAATA
jgi:hypothetical protein